MDPTLNNAVSVFNIATFVPLFGPLLGVLGTALVSWFLTKTNLKRKLLKLENENDELSKLLREKTNHVNLVELDLSNTTNALDKTKSELNAVSAKYQSVVQRLENSSVVREYSQPVLLVGPRSVGKTSLLKQWHSPWEHSEPSATHMISTSMVPIFDYILEDREPHFAISEIKTSVQLHLKLEVIDFPGELSIQETVAKYAAEKTKKIQNLTGKNIGVILICMFDAGEAKSGVNDRTVTYYNGDLFKKLRALHMDGKVDIDRIIIVFNKFDELKKQYPAKNNFDLHHLCLMEFKDYLKPLLGMVNPEKICEVMTVLGAEDPRIDNQGALVVLGEASRKFVKLMTNNKVQNFKSDNTASAFLPEFLRDN